MQVTSKNAFWMEPTIAQMLSNTFKSATTETNHWWISAFGGRFFRIHIMEEGSPWTLLAEALLLIIIRIRYTCNCDLAFFIQSISLTKTSFLWIQTGSLSLWQSNMLPAQDTFGRFLWLKLLNWIIQKTPVLKVSLFINQRVDERGEKHKLTIFFALFYPFNDLSYIRAISKYGSVHCRVAFLHGELIVDASFFKIAKFYLKHVSLDDLPIFQNICFVIWYRLHNIMF